MILRAGQVLGMTTEGDLPRTRIHGGRTKRCIMQEARHIRKAGGNARRGHKDLYL